MNPKRYMFCMFRTSVVLSLYPSLESVRTVLCVLRVARVVPRSVPGDIARVLRVLCVLQGDKKQKKEKKEKKKHKAEDKSKGKPEGRKEEKREERKEEAKPKKKDPKGKAKRIVAQDDDDALKKEVQQIKAEPARMASQPRCDPRSTHPEVPEEPLSPLGSASSNSSKSGSSKSSTSSSSGSSSSSESDKSAEKSPVPQKGVLKAAKTEALEKGKEKARPHFLVETHGRPPSKLPTGQTRQEKFTGSAHHVRSIKILKSFFNNEYGYLPGTFVHHYKNCCGQLKAATAAEGMRVHYVQTAVHGGFPCVHGDRRSYCARPICCARRLRMCPWRHACR